MSDFSNKKIKNKDDDKIQIYGKSSKKIPIIIGIISVFFILTVGVFAFNTIKNFNLNTGIKMVSKIADFVIGDEETHEKIYFLLVGRGGGNHDAPNLTDTIIMVGLDVDNSKITMLSIPRDFYVKRGDGHYGKINEIYAYSLQKTGDEEKAMQYLKDELEIITGKKISYFVNVDFSGFKSIVDNLGGVTIDVKQDLYDNAYPTPNGGWQIFYVKKGVQEMDGETALKYARSRHSTSDFDRSMRQQQIIMAIKDKILAGGVDSSNIIDLYNDYVKFVKTDIDAEGVLRIFKDFEVISNSEILSVNLNNTCYKGSSVCKAGGFLYNPPRDNYGGASVLLQNTAYGNKMDDFTEIQRFSEVVFDHQDVIANNDEINIYYTGSKNTKSYSNSWNIYGLLLQYGFKFHESDYITKIETGSVETVLTTESGSINQTIDLDFTKTTVYFNSMEEDSQTIDALKIFLKGEYVKVDYPLFSDNPNTKIEIVIGDDYGEVSTLSGSSIY